MHGVKLTEKEHLFCRALVANGGNKTQAARAAGYGSPRVNGHRVSQRPHVHAALHEARENRLTTRLGFLALGTMEQLIADDNVSPAVRFQAARWVLEAIGHEHKNNFEPNFEPSKPLTEMSADELQSFVIMGSEALDRMKQPAPRQRQTPDHEPTETAERGEAALSF